MKISKIGCLVVHAGMRNWIFVKVQTDQDGLHGWGEATLEWKTRSVVAAVEDLSDLLVGEDPRDITRCREIMRKQSFWRLGTIGQSAASAIETALWDVLGKDLGAPVWRLLGGKVRERISVYTHLGMGQMDAVYHSFSQEKLARHCAELKQRGYRAAKIVNVPYSHYISASEDVTAFADAIFGLREAVGPDFRIMIDFHGRAASPRVALAYIRAVEDADITFVEEPIQPGNHAGLAFIKEHSPIAVASGERLIEPDEFEAVLTALSVDIIQPDLCHCGGLTDGRRIAERAAVLGIGIAPHNPAGPVASATAAHFAAATPNHVIQEEMSGAVPWFNDVVSRNPINMIDGYWEIPAGPGLGIEIDEREAEKHPFQAESLETKNAVMADGTIVDW
ncbi:enolase C-terminal domain-like protein [Nitratireductor sp. XY-223]|uniref:enolase C-terminal domain-like protein n=1 Tax=Nitratireductor sp. XY-223 TaxID=2561926 RepID=UPI0010AA5535|nr:enolase C-terminal domain-like protein [Nitratireductor sp. XY-223]